MIKIQIPRSQNHQAMVELRRPLMGTSIAMIERHYSHLDAVKAVHQLRGEESRSLIEAAEAADEKYKFKEPKSARSRKR